MPRASPTCGWPWKASLVRPRLLSLRRDRTAAGPGQEGKPIATTWSQYIVQFDDLPLDGLAQMRVRLDLMGGGEVWADDVQFFDLAFNESELRALYKLLTLADFNLQNGAIGRVREALERLLAAFPHAERAVAAGRARAGLQTCCRTIF